MFSERPFGDVQRRMQGASNALQVYASLVINQRRQLDGFCVLEFGAQNSCLLT